MYSERFCALKTFPEFIDMMKMEIQNWRIGEAKLLSCIELMLNSLWMTKELMPRVCWREPRLNFAVCHLLTLFTQRHFLSRITIL